MRAVRGQVFPHRLEPLMLAFQGDMFGLKHSEFGRHRCVDALTRRRHVRPERWTPSPSCRFITHTLSEWRARLLSAQLPPATSLTPRGIQEAPQSPD